MIQGMGVALGTVAENGDGLVLINAEVGVFVGVYFGRHIGKEVGKGWGISCLGKR
jgi:hypothetical protein